MPLQSNFQLVLEHLHQSKFVRDNTYILQQLLPLVFVLLVPLFIILEKAEVATLSRLFAHAIYAIATWSTKQCLKAVISRAHRLKRDKSKAEDADKLSNH